MISGPHRTGATLALIAAVAVAGWIVQAAEMESSAPEAEGVSSAAIVAWIDACERELDAVHGFVILRHGRTVAEGWWRPYAAERTHTLYSQSKSFVSAAVGLLVDDGKLDLDAYVADIFPEKLPPRPSPRLRALRVRDLLSMNAGMRLAESGMSSPAGDWLANCLATPVKCDPGSRFQYDSGASYILAAIVERTGGERVMDLLDRRVFKPIGIEGAWSSVSPQGIVCGGWGMNMTTRDLARFGQLLLQEGRWGGQQLLSRDWVRLATAKQTASRWGSVPDLHQGYGFQFWRCRHNGYMAYGAYGQFLIVLPDQDAVISIHAGLDPIKKELDLVWKHLLPAMEASPLPDNPAAVRALKTRTAELALKTVRGVSNAPPDVLGRTYVLSNHRHRFGFRTVRLEERSGGWEAVFERANGRKVRIPVGYGTWREGKAVFEDGTCELLCSVVGEQPTAASGAWNGRTYRMRTYLHDTFFRLDCAFTFGEDGASDFALDLRGVWKGGRAKGTMRPESSGASRVGP